jgi:hypothetical protein
VGNYTAVIASVQAQLNDTLGPHGLSHVDLWD